MRIAAARVVLIGAVTAIGISVDPRVAAVPVDAAFVIQHVRLFDGERVFADRTVTIRDGVIDSITDRPRSTVLPIIDGRGKTLLPGLIDAHTHTEDPEQLRQALRFGVTTCLDMATPVDVMKRLSSAASAPDLADFRSAGILATAPGGHGTEPTSFLSRMGTPVPTVASAADAEPFVAARKAEGSDYLKIALNGQRAARRGMPTLAAATVKGLIDAAHARGMMVVAHIETGGDARTVVEAGGDGLAHIWRDHGADAEVAALFAAHHVFLVPTLTVPDSYLSASGSALAGDPRARPYLTDAALSHMTVAPPQAVASQLQPMTEFLAAVRSLAAYDVTIVAGTDVGATNVEWRHGVALHREIELYVKAGLTPLQALRTATANAADAFKLADRGRIVRGHRADLLLVNGDPLADITATRDIVRVWKAGVAASRKKVQISD